MFSLSTSASKQTLKFAHRQRIMHTIEKFRSKWGFNPTCFQEYYYTYHDIHELNWLYSASLKRTKTLWFQRKISNFLWKAANSILGNVWVHWYMGTWVLAARSFVRFRQH